MKSETIGETLLYAGIATYIISLLTPYSTVIIDLSSMTGYQQVNPMFLILATATFCFLVPALAIMTMLCIRKGE